MRRIHPHVEERHQVSPGHTTMPSKLESARDMLYHPLNVLVETVENTREDPGSHRGHGSLRSANAARWSCCAYKPAFVPLSAMPSAMSRARGHCPLHGKLNDWSPTPALQVPFLRRCRTAYWHTFVPGAPTIGHIEAPCARRGTRSCGSIGVRQNLHHLCVQTVLGMQLHVRAACSGRHLAHQSFTDGLCIR